MRKTFCVAMCVLLTLCMALCVLTACNKVKDSTNDLLFNLLDDDTYEVTGVKDVAIEKLIIPSEYNGKPVTKLSYDALYWCNELKF